MVVGWGIVTEIDNMLLISWDLCPVHPPFPNHRGISFERIYFLPYSLCMSTQSTIVEALPRKFAALHNSSLFREHRRSEMTGTSIYQQQELEPSRTLYFVRISNSR